MKKGSGMQQLLAVLLAVWMAAAGALGAAAQEEKKQVAMSFTARSALLMEQQTGKVLFSQNETQRVAPASLTKLMDLLLIFQQLQSGKLTMEQELTCSAYAKTMGGSEIWLKEGERMTVEELLKALVVASANDAAVVFAEAIAASEEEFVRLMNEKAQQLGLQNTHFVNCTGFDEEGHYTCAQDVAVLARELMTGYGEQLTRFSTIWMDSLRGGETQLVNTNKLVRFYDGTTGLKTGYTSAAGYCLSASAERNGMELIAVVLHCDTSPHRFESAKAMLNYGFSNYALAHPPADVDIPAVPVVLGRAETVTPEAHETQPVLIDKALASQVESSVEVAESVTAPVEKGQQLGTITRRAPGRTLAEIPLVAPEAVEALTWWDIFRQLLGKACMG